MGFPSKTLRRSDSAFAKLMSYSIAFLNVKNDSTQTITGTFKGVISLALLGQALSLNRNG
jgi:hypothetical protein